MSFISRYLWRRNSVPGTSADFSQITRDAGTGLKNLTGRFGVGFLDVEWEDPNELIVPETESKILGKDIPCILARIYYPTELPAESVDPKSFGTWLPNSRYFPGYGYFLRLPTLVSSGIGRLLAANVRIKAREAVPLISIESSSKEQLPIAIFSHGLGGIRTTYSTLCCELASRGMIVVALEHRDGSAAMTVDRKGKVYPYRFGPSGISLPSIDYDYRAAQLRHRIHELRSTTRFIESIQEAGDFSPLLSPNKETAAILKQFKGRILSSRLILLGHSFGAGTCLAAAQEIMSVSCCIAWDPWMFPMPHPHLEAKRTDIDTLIVLNEKFTWPENDAAIHLFIESMYNTDNHLAKVRMLGCGHMDQSDLASIVPASIIKILRTGSSIPANPHQTIQINAELAAAHLSASFPMFDFEAKWTIPQVEAHNRQKEASISETVETGSIVEVLETPLAVEDQNVRNNNNNLEKIESLIKVEMLINYK